ncbi:MAG: hypothetical protein GY830_01105, partial [Bacteroidetes bacterium]|nr:hypothetical protein [Bacteroidota bacterium]
MITYKKDIYSIYILYIIIFLNFNACINFRKTNINSLNKVEYIKDKEKLNSYIPKQSLSKNILKFITFSYLFSKGYSQPYFINYYENELNQDPDKFMEDGGTIYIPGTATDNSISNYGYLAFISKISRNGKVLDNQVYNSTLYATEFNDILVFDDIIFGHGYANFEEQSRDNIFISKINKNSLVPKFSFAYDKNTIGYGNSVVKNKNNFAFLSNQIIKSIRKLFFLILDEDGNELTQKIYSSNESIEALQMIYNNGKYYITGKKGDNLQTKLFYLRLNEFGSIDFCNIYKADINYIGENIFLTNYNNTIIVGEATGFLKKIIVLNINQNDILQYAKVISNNFLNFESAVLIDDSTYLVCRINNNPYIIIIKIDLFTGNITLSKNITLSLVLLLKNSFGKFVYSPKQKIQMINKQCPKCHHNVCTKDGKAKGKQRY